jgi:L-ectoine synthase
MLFRTIDEIKGTNRDVMAGNKNWVSRRLLLKKDGMGFGFNETIIFAGTETHIWYKHHLEAVYCVEGEGEIETVVDGKIYHIVSGTMYALNDHDEHFLRAFKDLRLLCVFNPPLTGEEDHLPDGSYPPVD